MTIEIRQIVIKSTVQRAVGAGKGGEHRAAALDIEAVKDTILTECRHLVIDLLREQQER